MELRQNAAWDAACQEGAEISKASFVIIEVVVIAIALLCFWHAWKRGRKATPRTYRPLFTMLAVGLFTFVAEWVLSHPTPGLDTIYCYPREWMINLLDVPLWIPLGWAWIVYIATTTSEELELVNWWHLPMMNGFLALTIDFLLDPIAVMEDWWAWDPAGKSLLFGIPLSNFMAWFVIVGSFTLAAQFFGRKIVAGRNLWQDMAAPALAIVPAFAVVYVNKLISDGMYKVRDAAAEVSGPYPVYSNGVLVCCLIWGVCAYLIFSKLYHFKRDKPLDKTLFLVPLSFNVLLLLFLVKNLYFDFRDHGVAGYNDYASLAVFMPAMAVVGMLLFAWPYLDAIFAPHRKKKSQ